MFGNLLFATIGLFVSTFIFLWILGSITIFIWNMIPGHEIKLNQKLEDILMLPVYAIAWIVGKFMYWLERRSK